MTQLAGKRVLIVEDHIIIAMDLAHKLASEGAKVIGPVATVAAAHDVIASTDLDGAILDINLSGKMVFPVADALADRHIPFVFATGYAVNAPARHAKVRRLQKPILPGVICRALEAAMSSALGEE
jgi:CheY-like chemotaxis protein